MFKVSLYFLLLLYDYLQNALGMFVYNIFKPIAIYYIDQKFKLI